MEKDLSKKMGQATKWSGLTEIIAKLISPITNAVLARLLVPEMFGVIATLTIVISFAEIFTDAGFQKYIVQHQFKDDEDIEISTNVAFWTNLTLSVIIWGVISYFAAPITNLVGSPGCELAITVMGLQIPLIAFSSIQIARYRRDFDFKSLFISRMATTMVPLVVTIPVAVYTKSYWALITGTLSREVLNAVILTVRSKWKPKLIYSFIKLKEMISFSLWTVVENVLIWMTNYLGAFIVSVSLNSYYLGLYKTSISTVNSITMLITSATSPVLFSALSRCQNDEAMFRNVFYKFQRMVALLVLPLGVGLFVYRELATKILLGNRWIETADFLGMWAITSSICILFSNYNSEVFRSKGKPGLSALTQILHIIVLVPVMLLFVKKGYHEVTAARSLIRLQIIAVSSVIGYFAFGISLWKALKNVWPSFIAAVIMGGAGIFLRRLNEGMVYEIFSVLICCFIYGAVMLAIPSGRKQLREIPMVNRALDRFTRNKHSVK